MEFGWSDDEDRYRSELRAFVDERVPEDWRAHPRHRHPEGEDDKQRVMAFTGALGERGWLTPHWPEEYGGTGSTAWQHMILGEELWSIGEPRGPQYMNVNWIGPSIMLFGTEEQKAYHLARISRGDIFWAQGFSEPDAGSDLATLKTAAVRDGDEYVVNGQKIWTSHCAVADWIYLLVRTDPTAERHKGISVLLVPLDTPGIEVNKIPGFAGDGAFNSVFFTDVRVPVANRLGAENDGWTVVRRTLQFERVGAPHWARATLYLDRVAEWAAAQGKLDDPFVAARLGSARAAVEACRILNFVAVNERAKGEEQSAVVYLARAASARAVRAVGDAVIDVMGPDAIPEGTTAWVAYTESAVTGIAAGAYEVQLDLVSRLLLQLPVS